MKCGKKVTQIRHLATKAYAIGERSKVVPAVLEVLVDRAGSVHSQTGQQLEKKAGKIACGKSQPYYLLVCCLHEGQQSNHAARQQGSTCCPTACDYAGEKLAGSGLEQPTSTLH